MSDETQEKSGSQLYLERVTESLQHVLELSTRIDERVQLLMKKQNELDHKLDATMVQTNALSTKIMLMENVMKTVDGNSASAQSDIQKLKDTVHNIEIRIFNIEGNQSRHNDRWRTIVNFGIQIIWTLAATYLLVKLGLQKP